MARHLLVLILFSLSACYAVEPGSPAWTAPDMDRGISDMRLDNADWGVRADTSESVDPTADYEFDIAGCHFEAHGETSEIIDLAVRGGEIWVSVWRQHGRTGASCLVHYDGSTWASRMITDFALSPSMLTVDDDGVLLYHQSGFNRALPQILAVPREFMRSDTEVASLIETTVPEAVAFRWHGFPADIWKGPNGLWLYQGDRALFLRSE